jgi:hypothetical protein
LTLNSPTEYECIFFPFLSMSRTTCLLKKYCFGDQPVNIKVL